MTASEYKRIEDFARGLTDSPLPDKDLLRQSQGYLRELLKFVEPEPDPPVETVTAVFPALAKGRGQ